VPVRRGRRTDPTAGLVTAAASVVLLAVMAVGAYMTLRYSDDAAAQPPRPAAAAPAPTLAPIADPQQIIVSTGSGLGRALVPSAPPPAEATATPVGGWFATAAGQLAARQVVVSATPTDGQASPIPSASPSGQSTGPTATARPSGPPPPLQIDLPAARATARALEPTQVPPPPTLPPALPTRTTVASSPDAQRAAVPSASPRAASTRRATPTPRPTRTGTPAPTRTARPQMTVTPARTPTNYTPPVIRNGDNKWGVGVYKDSNRVVDLLRETQPGVILLMDPTEGWARRVREAAPNAFIVGRRFRAEDDQPLDQPEARGEEFADWVAELAVPLKGVVDAWMSYNEVLGSDPSLDYRNYNRFQVAFAHRLQDVHGVAAVAGNDGSGAIEPEDYATYFADAIRASQFLGIHAYSPPGTASIKQDAEWNVLRYRKINAALEKIGIKGRQMVLTETGLGDGFRPSVATDDQMAADYAWLTEEMRKDPYVIGQAAFGIFDATGAWPKFDLTESSVPRLLPSLLQQR
jgi:hypothetical protein